MDELNGALTDYGNFKDTRGTNEPPSYYYKHYKFRMVNEFKNGYDLGLNNYTYVSLTTYVDWIDGSAVLYQLAFCGTKVFTRSGGTSDYWTDWQELVTKSDLTNYPPYVTSGNGAFGGLVKPNEAWLIIGTRISVAETIILVCNNYNGNMSINQIFATANMSYVTNEQGTVQLYYVGSDMGIFSCAIRIA